MYKAIYGLPGLYLGALIGFLLTLVVPIDMRLAFAVIMGAPIGALLIGIPLINVGARKDRDRPRRWGYESAFRVGVCMFLGLYSGPILFDIVFEIGGIFYESIILVFDPSSLWYVMFILSGFLGVCGGIIWSFVAYRQKRPLHWIYETVFRVCVGAGVGFLVSPALHGFLLFIPFIRSLIVAGPIYLDYIVGSVLGAVFGALWPYISAQIKRKDTGTTAV